jgi:D-alanyl-lipoteichoic acid acyltransferase DltB (MBOAT superfamily)
LEYAGYVTFFPQLIAGPIVLHNELVPQLLDKEKRKFDPLNFRDGVVLFILGLAKKVLIADFFAKTVNFGFEKFVSLDTISAWLVAISYSFEIYFDFSGYSDMAVGISLMFRIDLPMNFDSPYKALSVREFWKRWHISLTRFFTKYVYVPLGGSRKGRAFTCLNIMIVFLISGLWHGAGWTFILWGVLHGVLVCFDRIFEKWEEKIFVPVRWLCTFGAVGVLWLLFNAETVGQWKDVLCKIAFMQSTAVSEGVIASFGLAEDSFLRHLPGLQYLQTNVRGFNMLAFLLVSCIVCFIPENNYRKKESLSVASMLLTAIAFIWGILCLGTESAFVYFGF